MIEVDVYNRLNDANINLIKEYQIFKDRNYKLTKKNKELSEDVRNLVESNTDFRLNNENLETEISK